MKIDIGCGPNKRDADAIGVDIRDYPPVDVVADIETGLPFADNTVSHVYAYSVLEHMTELPPVMAEIHRVCENGAIIEGKVPHWKDKEAYIDPTHKQLFDQRTFYYWSDLYAYQPDYFGHMFHIKKSERVWRVQFWKSRPILFRLEVVK